ncbi:meiotic recombination protein DMC1 homolog isoform X1 [Syzygium oleosum]|uniref:meiotic recombination protein DMC1 homolog isoform X1 n=1 Tax=Syzygium oleosum TaxID=219896 RepID=UPI0024B9FA2A|nr:meiotic recombination protein DMC1 homolog isoform X1 [Syzygium oleosum]
MDPGAVLDNIIYARAYTYEHQHNLLLGLAAKMSEEPIRLLQKLAQMLSRLLKTAEEFNLAVYMTNQVVTDPGSGVFLSDPKNPAGRHVLAHAATIRLMFRKGKDNTRGHSQCKGLKRSLQPGRPGEVHFFFFESAI